MILSDLTVITQKYRPRRLLASPFPHHIAIITPKDRKSPVLHQVFVSFECLHESVTNVDDFFPLRYGKGICKIAFLGEEEGKGDSHNARSHARQPLIRSIVLFAIPLHQIMSQE